MRGFHASYQGQREPDDSDGHVQLGEFIEHDDQCLASSKSPDSRGPAHRVGALQLRFSWPNLITSALECDRFDQNIFWQKGRLVVEPLELWSSRLCLRRLREEDAPAIVAYRGLADVARFQSWESFGLSDAVRLIADQAAVVPDTPGTWLQLAMVTIKSGLVIGDCGIHFRGEDPRQVELGITLAPAHQGGGLATEALRAVVAYVFDRLGKHRVSAVVDAENHAAVRLLKRLGLRQEAHYVEHVWFKGAWGSEYLFALLRREWQSATPSLRS
jgi:RimJ/RimL family protein N-acetyltransferase